MPWGVEQRDETPTLLSGWITAAGDQVPEGEGQFFYLEGNHRVGSIEVEDHFTRSHKNIYWDVSEVN